MIVSRVNLINTYNKRVLPFKGDTLNNKKLEETPQNKNKLDKPTKFLIGSLAGSAAIIGLVFAGKYGLLGSSIKNLFKAGENAAQKLSTEAPNSSSVVNDVVGEVKSLTAKVVNTEKLPLVKPDSVSKNPFEKTVVSHEPIDKTKGNGYIAAMLTNKENAIIKLPAFEQADEFSNYLHSAISSLSPQEARGHILFRPGKYAMTKNEVIAKRAIEIAKENPDYAPAIVNNLLSYELPASHANSNGGEFELYVQNLLNIRKLLRKSGLPCDDSSRLKARRDWLDTGYHTPNSYVSLYKKVSNMPEFRRQAFWYDMSLGIDRKTADEIIEHISVGKTFVKSTKVDNALFENQKNKLTKINYMQIQVDRGILDDKSFLSEVKLPLPIEKDLGLSLETIIKKINKSVVEN